MASDFYDHTGAPIAYSPDDIHIYLFSGEPVAYFDGSAVYAFDGAHVGWFEDGWIIDTNGRRALFSGTATGGPVKPVKQVKPVKGVKQVKPVKGVKAVKYVKAVKILSWSPLSGAQLFYQ